MLFVSTYWDHCLQPNITTIIISSKFLLYDFIGALIFWAKKQLNSVSMTVPQKVFTKKETTVDTMWEGTFWPFNYTYTKEILPTAFINWMDIISVLSPICLTLMCCNSWVIQEFHWFHVTQVSWAASFGMSCNATLGECCMTSQQAALKETR